ncbi:hypothetical protein GW17_00050815 [Ensete ventricosum]|nr:hypothetical protein GW17_00050815 [Ensete ventricosum]
MLRSLCGLSILLMLLLWQLLLPPAETRPFLPSPTHRWPLQLLQALPQGPVVPSGPSACTHSPPRLPRGAQVPLEAKLGRRLSQRHAPEGHPTSAVVAGE